MARTTEFEEFIDYLLAKPWWASVAVGATFFVVFRYAIPSLPIEWGLFEIVVEKGSPMISWLGFIFLLPAVGSVARTLTNRRLLDANKTKESIRDLDCQTFEDLIEAYYRDLNYLVEHQREGGPDGGVDVRITNEEGKRFLIQCKHWRTQQVGVKVVRELLGVVTAERAAGGIVITSGAFTLEAYEFARNVAVELIDGDRLQNMLSDRLSPT